MAAQVPTSVTELIVCNIPTKELALTNYAYCCRSDLRRFSVRGLTRTYFFASIANGLILCLHPHDSIPPGHIAINAIQRVAAGVSVGDTVSATRPSRNLKIRAEKSLPNENERLQMLQNHTNKMEKYCFLSPDVNLQELAARAENYTGAEIEGVVNCAALFALNRQLSLDDLTKPIDEESIRVTMEDFLKALREITPVFGASTNDLKACRLRGMVDCGVRHEVIYGMVMQLAEQVKAGEGSPLVTCLLEGPIGSGKTAMAETIGIDSDIPYVKIVSAWSMVGLHENDKCTQISKVFEYAYKSPLSVIVLDDIERLLEYSAIGPHFSDVVCQTLLILLERDPPEERRLLVIGTTSEIGFLDEIGIRDAFTFTYRVPSLSAFDAKKVLQQLNVFAEKDIDEAAELLDDMPIKKLYSVVDMAAVSKGGRSSKAIYSGKEMVDMAAVSKGGRSSKGIYSGKEKININYFKKCLKGITKRY